MIERASRINYIEEYYFQKNLRKFFLWKNRENLLLIWELKSDIPPDIEVINALKKSLSHPKASMYQSYQGLPELRKAISNSIKIIIM